CNYYYSSWFAYW
nr:immunoglobulin heavy chain junction region [Mus musculus]